MHHQSSLTRRSPLKPPRRGDKARRETDVGAASASHTIYCSGALISCATVSLSPAIIAITVPTDTPSTAFSTSHLASAPFSVVGDKAGIFNSIGILFTEEQFGGGFDDRVYVQPIVAVKINQIAGLAETIGAEGADPHALHTAQPR